MKLRELRDEVCRAEQALYAAIKERFQPGMKVRVRSGSRVTEVTVQDTSADWVKVFNPETGESNWVGAYRLVEFDSL